MIAYDGRLTLAISSTLFAVIALAGCCISGPCFDFVETSVNVVGRYNRVGSSDSLSVITFNVHDSLDSRHPLGVLLHVRGRNYSRDITSSQPSVDVYCPPGEYSVKIESLYRNLSENQEPLSISLQRGDSVAVKVSLGGAYVYKY